MGKYDDKGLNHKDIYFQGLLLRGSRGLANPDNPLFPGTILALMASSYRAFALCFVCLSADFVKNPSFCFLVIIFCIMLDTFGYRHQEAK